MEHGHLRRHSAGPEALIYKKDSPRGVEMIKNVLIVLIAMLPVVVQAEAIYAVGDIADCRDKPESPAKAPAAMTATWIPDDADVLLLGDLVYPAGEKKFFEECYKPTWGRHDLHAFPALGNHEYSNDPTADGYFNYFSANTLIKPPGYYSFERNHWLLLSLNSNLDGEAFYDQMEWLKGLLDRDGGKHACILAFWHHPLYTSGFGRIDDLERINKLRAFWFELHNAHADLVLNGHEHLYEAFEPLNENGEPDATGPRQFIVGTGGGKLGGFNDPPAAGSHTGVAHRYAVMKLELLEHSYRWELRNGSSVLDSGAAECMDKIDH